MSVMTHGRAQVQDVEVGARRDGADHRPAGPDHLPTLAPIPTKARRFRHSRDRWRLVRTLIPQIRFTATAVTTNTTPIGAYRGAGRPEATALLERVIDMLAVELGMDPVGEASQAEPHPADRVPLRDADGALSTTPADTSWRWTRRSTSPATKVLRKEQRGPVATGATACSSASASASTSR